MYTASSSVCSGHPITEYPATPINTTTSTSAKFRHIWRYSASRSVIPHPDV